ncbi:MAG TPA: putative CRISPR-associated protein [Candidatus Obscuribacterales bacterium]
MLRLLISTIGTSLLTNQIDQQSDRQLLNKTANLTPETIPTEAGNIIEKLKSKASEKLKQGVKEIRRASAELNGIYGLYQEQLEQGRQDMHFLIATDTAQGQATANVVKSFLQTQGLTVDTYTPSGLSTASTESFSHGIDKLLEWIDDTIPNYEESGYKVCFNLVGSFKSLQGYLNTIGMFYADEIIYIFEGSSEVITIPRLPISLDNSVIQPYVVEFALMAQGAEVNRSKLPGVPETLIFAVDDEVTLRNWGRLIWNRSKEQLLSKDLLAFPQIRYEPSFVRDYERVRSNSERVKLQEILAKVAHLLIKNNGDTGALKGDGGVLYEVYKNKGGIGHFRVTQGLRVSCVVSDEGLLLRHYGAHDYVNDNP